MAFAALYGLVFDRSVRPDPFTTDPALFDWLLYGQPDPALQTSPMLPAGWGGTLVFRPTSTAWLSWSPTDFAALAGVPDAATTEQPRYPGFARCTQDGRRCWLVLPLADNLAVASRLLVSDDGGASWNVHSMLSPAIAVPADNGRIDDHVAAVFLDDPAAGWLVTHSGRIFLFDSTTRRWEQVEALAEDVVSDLNGEPLYFTVQQGRVELDSTAPGSIGLGLPVHPQRGFEVLMPGEDGDWFFIQADGSIGSRSAKSPPPPAERLLAEGQFLTLWSYISVWDPSQQFALVAGHNGTFLRFSTVNGRALKPAISTLPMPVPIRSLAFDPFSNYGSASSGWNDSPGAGGRPVIFQTTDGGANWRLLAYRASSAPWVLYLVLPAFLVVGGLAGAGWWQYWRNPLATGGIENRGQTDQPIGWNDLDVLGLRGRAKALSRLIRNMATAPPLTVAITGPWGSGKSSLMNLVVGDLRRFGTRPVWFNAWHHQQEESLLASLLEAVRSQSVPSIWCWDGLWFRLGLFWARSRRSLVYVFVLLGVLLLAVLAILLFMQLPWAALAQALGDFLNPPDQGQTRPDPWQRAWEWFFPEQKPASEETWFDGILAFVGFSTATAFLPTLLKRLRVITSEPAKLLTSLGSRGKISGFQDKLSLRHRFADEYGLVCHRLRAGRGAGVVIVIDDLDRCSPANVMTVLEAVNFLVSAGECFVILGIDYERVLHSIAATYKDSLHDLPDALGQGAAKKLSDDAGALRAHAVRYLEKLINIVVAVPGPSDQSTRKLLTGVDHDARSETPSLIRRRRWAGRLSGLVRGATDYAPAILLLGLLFAALIGLAQKVPTLLPPPEAAATPPPNEAAGSPEQLTQPDPGAAALHQAPLQAPLALPDTSAIAGEWIPWALLGAAALALALLLLRRKLTPPEQEVTDSDDFQRSLEAFAPVVQALNDTPRAVKRFQNNLRLLALLDRPASERPSWLERLFGVPELVSSEVREALEDDDIVILSTAAEVLRRAGLRDTPLRESTATLCGGVDVKEASDALRECLRNYYGSRKRPSEDEVNRFFDLASATRPQR